MSDADLIESVQQFTVIWNKNDQNHENKLIVQNAWKAVGAALNVAPDICEQRFSNIRNRYAKERRKLQECSRSGAGAYEIQWPHYSACSFLDKVIVPRNNRSNYQKPGSQAATDAEDSESVTVEDILNDTEADTAQLTLNDVFQHRTRLQLPPNISRVPNMPATPSTSRASTEYSTPERPSSASTSYSSGELTDSHHRTSFKSRKGVKTEDVSNIAKCITGAFDKLDKLVSNSNHREEMQLELTDEDYAFGRTVALSLKNINSSKIKLKLKAQIMSMIADATDSD